MRRCRRLLFGGGSFSSRCTSSICVIVAVVHHIPRGLEKVMLRDTLMFHPSITRVGPKQEQFSILVSSSPNVLDISLPRGKLRWHVQWSYVVSSAIDNTHPLLEPSSVVHSYFRNMRQFGTVVPLDRAWFQFEAS